MLIQLRELSEGYRLETIGERGRWMCDVIAFSVTTTSQYGSEEPKAAMSWMPSL